MSTSEACAARANFVASLAETRAALACPSCCKTFSRPVRYSVCLHTVCFEHVSVSTFCPVCRADVRDSGVVHDEELGAACQAVIELERLYSDGQVESQDEPMNATMKKAKVEIAHEALEVNSEKKRISMETNTKTAVSGVNLKKDSRDEPMNATKKKAKVETARETLEAKKIINSDKKSTSMETNTKTEVNSKELRNKSMNATMKIAKVDIARMPMVNKIGSSEMKSSSLKMNTKTAGSGVNSNKVTNSAFNGFTGSIAEIRGSRTSSQTTPKGTSALEKRNHKGETPLHVACRCLKIEKIVELLDKGADPNTKDNAGWTPLHEVCQQGSLEAVLLLLKHGALPAVPALHNETPLHEAVRYGRDSIAAVLVAHGADINARNSKGETPLTLVEATMRDVMVARSNAKRAAAVSVRTASDSADVHVYCDTADRAVRHNLDRLARHHDIHVEGAFNNKVTHTVVATDADGSTACGVAALRAVLRGAWLLNGEWVLRSSHTSLASPVIYEVSGIGSPDFHGPSRSRINRLKKLPGLFDGCHFYFHNFQRNYEMTKTLVFTKSLLTQMILDGGGMVLRREPNPESIPACETMVPYHAAEGSSLARCSHYIIFWDMFVPMYNMAHIKALPIGWLIECIQKFELCEPQ